GAGAAVWPPAGGAGASWVCGRAAGDGGRANGRCGRAGGAALGW
ncbi:short chain dehydrogenase, partial [Burkholderia mallei]